MVAVLDPTTSREDAMNEDPTSLIARFTAGRSAALVDQINRGTQDRETSRRVVDSRAREVDLDTASGHP